MDGTTECPVCEGCVLTSDLNIHMAGHAKEDIVAALLRQRSASLPMTSSVQDVSLGVASKGPSSSSVIPGFSSVSAAKKVPDRPSVPFDITSMPSPSTAGPFLMPQMMGMMQVISPCFIPQPNGPPILVNLPSYIYPNIGMMGGMLAAAANAASPLIPSSSTAPTSSDPIPPNFSNPSTSATPTLLPPYSLSTSDQPGQVEMVTAFPTASTLNTPVINPTQSKSSKTDAKDEVIKSSQKPKMTECEVKNEQSVAGCTRYASDSRYPAASISFDSALSDADKQHSIKYESDVDDEDQFEPSPRMKLEPGIVKDETDDEEEENDDENSNVCTVHTVADLQNALKSEEDIQIVVPNELLETTEFKVFLSNLGPFPTTSVASPSTGSATNASTEEVCQAPPNTPAVTRPPSAAPPSSPQPCSSRDLSRSGFPGKFGEKIVSDISEGGDDITLEDLVAMETMEDDICDDDNYYQMSHNPLEPFIRHDDDFDNDHDSSSSAIFSCSKCGLQFDSFGEFNRHKTVCCKWRNAKGIGKKSSKKSTKLVPDPPPLNIDDSNANLDPLSVSKSSTSWNLLDMGVIKSEQSSLLSSSDLIRNSSTVKSETFDSTSQPALAAAGANHWKCNQCKVVFESGPLLWEHLDSLNRAVNKCSICHLAFEDRKQALAHRKKFHPSLAKIKQEPAELIMPNENGDFFCRTCDRAFKDRDLLVKHQSCHDEAKPYECLECGKKFSKGSLLRNHRRRHFEVGAFECQTCQKRFYTPNKLKEHERVHTREAPLSCNVCGKTFRRHSNLSEHKRIHLEVRPIKPPKELFCHCGKVFATQRDLDWHKEGEHDKIPKKCSFCGEIFVHGSSLTRHIRLKHSSDFMPTDKKSSLYAKCPICQQTFYKTSINKHIRIKHHGQKPFQCDVCKMSFVTKCNLINHQWQHKGVRARPFKCQLCNKSYLRKSLLDAHIRSHRGVKPFVCNECGLQFANKSNWQRHVAEHSGSRNYRCHLCEKKFSRNYYLSDHLKTHTGEKPFVCGICGKSAATRSNYNSHLRTHITREPVNSEV